MNILAPKIGTIQLPHPHNNGCFLENGSLDFDELRCLMEIIIVNKTAQAVTSEK
jgi:hypothetical protein